MIGIIKQRDRRVIAKCGFKYLRLGYELKQLIFQQRLDRERRLQIQFKDDDITHENMTAISIKNGEISTNLETNFRDMNCEHFSRFMKKYGDSLNPMLSLAGIQTMDVIDIKAVQKISSEVDLASCPVFTFTKDGVQLIGHGFNVDCPESAHVYMAVKNGNHTLDQVDNKCSLTISKEKDQQLDLLFLKFGKELLKQIQVS